MNDSLRLSVADLTDEATASAFFGVADAAATVDGQQPFNEQARLDVTRGKRTPLLGRLDELEPVSAAIVGRGELDLVVAPAYRRQGLGRGTAQLVLANVRGELSAWSHGDHPAARALALRFGFVAARTLLRLRLPSLDGFAGDDGAGGSAATGADTAAGEAPGTIAAFAVGRDETAWVELNARVFAQHPEQGQLTIDDVRAREAEPWFDAGDFLLARDTEGKLLGYNWLKIDREPGSSAAGSPGAPEGEIYVIGVAPEAAGQGLGRRLMTAGLARLAEQGCRSATLYVEADNAPAVALYRSLGFVDDNVDVQYRRAL